MQVDYQLADGKPFLGVKDGVFTRFGGGQVEVLPGVHVAPAFVDNHCHILPTGLGLNRLDLTECCSHEEVLDAVAQRHREQPEGWLHAVQYDQNKYPGVRHITKEQLDGVVGARPALLRHFNGHAGVASSAALLEAGVDDSTPDPHGGTYRRDADGRVDGVLLERALEIVSGAAPTPSMEQMVDAIVAAGESMAKLGIGTATDMMTGQYGLETELRAYHLASQRGCPIRLRLFMQWNDVLGRRAIDPGLLRELMDDMDGDRCRAEGVKIFSDGAIGSATAAIHGTFLTGGNGHLIYSPDRLGEMVRVADDAGWRVAIHAIGDRATDHVMDAYEATADPSRHRIEHAMILSDAQIERLAKLGSHVAMQPEFLYRRGSAYRAQLPAETARKLNRAKSLLEAGVPLSFSSDRPVVPGEPLIGIESSVKKPDGFDPGEQVTWQEAYAAYTTAGADGNGDRGQAALEAGKWADFAVFDKDPRQGGALQRLYVGGEAVPGSPGQ